MRIIEVKRVFRCEHCNKLFQLQTACAYHEKICNKNSENFRPCHSCPSLTKRTVYHTHERYGLETEHPLNLLFCKSKQHFLITPKTEIKGNQWDVDEIVTPMPKQCDHYDKIKNPDLDINF